jgi:hypothetical protein
MRKVCLREKENRDEEAAPDYKHGKKVPTASKSHSIYG